MRLLDAAARTLTQAEQVEPDNPIVLANLGLTTQLAALGVCLVVGAPSVYLWLVLGCLALTAVLHARAELRVRRPPSTRPAA